MKHFWSNGKTKILVGLLAVLLGFMIAAVYTEGSSSVFSDVVSVVTIPIQRVSSSISNWASGWFQAHTDSEALYEENQRLQKEVQQLREEMVDYDRIKHENQQYQAIINTAEKHTDWELEPAAVVVRDSQNRFSSFSIDKGSIHGISYLDPVIASDGGLIGYVSEVGATYAKVLTILDVRVDVGAYDSKDRDIGVVSGTVELAEEGLCAMEYLPRDTSVQVGNLILTSGSLTGGTSIFPRDILIGTVIRMETDAHGTNPIAIVQPTTDIGEVKDVFVITNFQGQGSQTS